MFRHIFLYNLKNIIRTRAVIFWSFLYPIILATLFFFAFSNLSKADNFEAVDIAVTDSSELAEGSDFYGALAAVSNIDGTALDGDIFRAIMTSTGEADRLLKNGDISAYILFDDGIKLVVGDSGFKQTIAKVFIDDYLHTGSMAKTILSENPEAANRGFLSDISRWENYLAQSPASASSSPDTTVIMFYTLLAMTCLMGSTVSIDEIIKLQANMSPLAARINVAPVPKFRIFLYNIGAAALFQLTVILIVLAYIIFGLNVDFGDKTGYTLLTCAIGGITGIFFGTAVSSGFKSTGLKYAVTIGGTMLSCFLSGMMVVDMKYIIQVYAPVIGYLSPANLITDAFYSLYYYDGLARYFENILALCVFSILFCTATCLILRRKKYASL